MSGLGCQLSFLVLSCDMLTVPTGMCAHHVAYRTLGADGLLACGFMVKDPGFDARNDRRSAYSAVLCLRGRGWFQAGSGPRQPIVPGSLFQRLPDAPHTLWIAEGEPWAECWIHLDARIATMLAGLGVLKPESAVRARGLDLPLLRELWRATDALTAAPDRTLPEHLVRLQGLLLSLLGRPEDHPDHLPELDADRACRLLAEDPTTDLRHVARELGLGYELFRKRFRAATGQSPGAYRLRRRLERARVELLTTRKTVAEIAEGLGYANPFTFTALFRRHVGCAPAHWRARGG
jgi:AraC family transcriptional regulator of arabinose operon